MLKIYFSGANQGQATAEPVYVVKDGCFFRTVYHPSGWSEHHDYELKPDGKVYRAPGHPLGASDNPDYAFNSDRGLYRTANHPEGICEQPDYVLADQ